MAEQTTATTVASIQSVANDLRNLGLTLDTQLEKLGSLMTAFRLAANADSDGGTPALYWPTLVEFIEEAIPDRETIDRMISAIVDDLDVACAASATGPSVTTARRPRTALTESALVR